MFKNESIVSRYLIDFMTRFLTLQEKKHVYVFFILLYRIVFVFSSLINNRAKKEKEKKINK